MENLKEIKKAMQEYLDNFRKFSKEHPEEAREISRARLIKLGLIEDNKEDNKEEEDS